MFEKSRAHDNNLSMLEESTYNILKQVVEVHPHAPWVIAFSGGKDSTLLLHLVANFLSISKRLPPKLYLLYNDTLGELPEIHEWAYRVLRDASQYIRRIVDLGVVITKPNITDSFYWRVIVRGYPAPTYKFRWCTTLLKIEPTKKVLKELAKKHDEILLLTGLRSDESHVRAGKIKRSTYSVDGLGKYLSWTEIPRVLKVLPLRDWRETFVWLYLREQAPPWSSNKDYYERLLTFYLKVPELKANGDTVRFGCWFCTVAARHKGLEALLQLSKVFNNFHAKAFWLARMLIRKISDCKTLRVPKDSGYSHLGPLNTCARALILHIFRILDEKIGLYGLNEKVREGVTLRELFFEIDHRRANKIIRTVDISPRARATNLGVLRNFVKVCDSNSICKDLLNQLNSLECI